MKKFIIKSSAYVLPFIILYFVNVKMHNITEGDLTRVGLLYSNESPGSVIKDKEGMVAKDFTSFSESIEENTIKFKYLVIGDSYSDQGVFSYANYLSNLDTGKVLYIDRFISRKKPIETLFHLSNGDFFDSLEIDYVILQCAERVFVERALKVNGIDRMLNFDSLVRLASVYVKPTHNSTKKFFSHTTLSIPLANLCYLIMDNPPKSMTYKTRSTTNHLFNSSPNHILFYKNDIINLQLNNNKDLVQKSNELINLLSQKLRNKGVRLMLIISPDKYDLYYPYIEDNSSYDAPQFFEHFNLLNKSYLYVDLKATFSEALMLTKDLYYYDDTHWSPVGARIVADEIYKISK